MSPGSRQALLLLALSAVVGLGANPFRQEPLSYTASLEPPPEAEPGADLAPTDLSEVLPLWEEGAFFLDVRPLDEFEARRVSGAFSFPPADFDDRYFTVVGPFGDEVPLFVYGAGPDSFEVRRMAAKLIDYGHSVGFANCGLDCLLELGISEGAGPEEGP